MLADYWAGLLAETIVAIVTGESPAETQAIMIGQSPLSRGPGRATGSDTVTMTIGSAGEPESKPGGPSFKLAETIGLSPGWTIGRDYYWRGGQHLASGQDYWSIRGLDNFWQVPRALPSRRQAFGQSPARRYFSSWLRVWAASWERLLASPRAGLLAKTTIGEAGRIFKLAKTISQSPGRTIYWLRLLLANPRPRLS
jgi:hypothetical protein